MSEREYRKQKRKMLLPQIICIILTLISGAAFFLPFTTMDMPGDQQTALPFLEGIKVSTDSDITLADMFDTSLYTYTRIFYQHGKEIWHGEYDNVIFAIVVGLPMLFTLFVLLFVLTRMPIPAILSAALMVGSIFFGRAVFNDYGVASVVGRYFSIGYGLYLGCAVVLCLSLFWLAVTKRLTKRAYKRMFLK